MFWAIPSGPSTGPHTLRQRGCALRRALPTAAHGAACDAHPPS
eukprot:CAMPEP_0185515844 /NCGR_PEP_ID=MMETSP1366-20130426/63823_1 /TAXON_ID=38817 /ORGANISM="Gephyrocapsa oceanica, Strain RCC1303" /LENGTH=42 /DNA_ID= /DNA_START= /DNA_END= /DNA_ORIENTATION=